VFQELGNATVGVNNPPGVVFAAKLPADANWKEAYPDGGNVKGSIAAVASPNGIGVLFKVKFSNLPKEGGPFSKYYPATTAWAYTFPSSALSTNRNHQPTTCTTSPSPATATAPTPRPTSTHSSAATRCPATRPCSRRARSAT
jgi:hypothetical protein